MTGGAAWPRPSSTVHGSVRDRVRGTEDVAACALAAAGGGVDPAAAHAAGAARARPAADAGAGGGERLDGQVFGIQHGSGSGLRGWMGRTKGSGEEAGGTVDLRRPEEGEDAAMA